MLFTLVVIGTYYSYKWQNRLRMLMETYESQKLLKEPPPLFKKPWIRWCWKFSNQEVRQPLYNLLLMHNVKSWQCAEKVKVRNFSTEEDPVQPCKIRLELCFQLMALKLACPVLTLHLTKPGAPRYGETCDSLPCDSSQPNTRSKPCNMWPSLHYEF